MSNRTALVEQEREVSDRREFLLGPELSFADFYMLPIIHAFGFAPEGQAMYPNFSAICTWRERMEALPTMKRFRWPRSRRALRSSKRADGWSRTGPNTEARIAPSAK